MADQKIRIEYEVDDKELKLSRDLIKQIAKELGVSEEQVEELNKGLKKQEGILEKLERQEKELRAARSKSQDPKQISKYNAQIKGTRARIDKLTGSTRGFSSAISKAGPLIAATFSVGAIKSFGEAAVNAFKDFDASIQSLSAITGLVGDDLDKLRSRALGFSQGLTFEDADGELFRLSVSATDAAQAFELLGSKKPELLGYPDLLADVTEQALILSKASGLDLPTAIDSLAGSLNQFGEGADQAKNFVDAFAAASQAGAAPVPALAQSIGQFGSVAKAAGLDVFQAAAAVETLADKNLLGSEAGIKLRNVLITLQQDSANYTDGVFDLDKALVGLAKRQNDTIGLTKDFGKQTVVAAQILAQNVDRFDELEAKIRVNGVALKQAGANAVTFANAQENARNAVQTLLIQIGESLAPALQSLAEIIAEGASRFDEFKAEFAPIVGLFEVAGELIRDLGMGDLVDDVDLVGESFKILGAVIRTAVLGPIELLNLGLKEFAGIEIYKEIGLVSRSIDDFGVGLGIVADSLGMTVEETKEFAKGLSISKDTLVNYLAALESGNLSLEEQERILSFLKSQMAANNAETTAAAIAQDDFGDAVDGASKKTPPAAGSIAALNAEISALKKELLTTNPSLERAAKIQEQIETITQKVTDKINEQKKAYELLKDSAAGSISSIEKQQIRGFQNESERQEAITTAFSDRLKEEQRLAENQYKAQQANFEAQDQEELSRKEELTNALLGLGAAAGEALLTFEQARLNKQLQALEDQKQKELALAEGNAQRQAEIEAKFAKRSGDLKKQNAIKEIAINTAIAIVKAYASLDPVLASIAAAGIVITSAAQVALVNSQQFAKGGYTGPGTQRDSSGQRVAGVVHEHEYVIDRHKTKRFRPLLDAIHGGKFKTLDDLFINPSTIIKPSVNVSGMSDRRMVKELQKLRAEIKPRPNRRYF